MKQSLSIAAASILSIGLSVFIFPDITKMALAMVFTYWWVLPLSISIASFVGLGTAAIMRSFRRIPSLTASSTAFYLAVGPSVVGLNLVPIVSTVPPAPWWAYPSLVVLTFSCAWAYYVASSGAEDSEPLTSFEAAFTS